MGMDVYGKNPTSKAGEYFRNNVWSWRPLADYICSVAPEIAQHCKHWQTNDGDGLDADQAVALADKLESLLKSSEVDEYAKTYQENNDTTPDEICRICEGTGKRRKAPEIGAGDNHCNGCKATGKYRPSSTWYRFSAENVREFAQFSRHSGGFEIN